MRDVSYFAHSPAAKNWEGISLSPHHGFSVPLFSIHSERSNGIGEFPDLFLLCDWCKSLGFDIIQLLPLNDPGMGISPYSTISAFALNPLYIGLSFLPFLEKHQNIRQELEAIPKFSRASQVDYEKVRESKEKFLRHYFSEVGKDVLQQKEFTEFIGKANHWLRSYAAYKILKKKNGESVWENWPATERIPDTHLIDQICDEYKKEYDWECFLQFICDLQMRAVKSYASKQGILLMGDIPILIDRDSADVWMHQELFNFDYGAGSAPDMYSDEGQNWGFPIYRWESMENRDHLWWRQRLQWATPYYHIYRIDHIVGFFRIWSIPYGCTAKEGQYIPQDRKIWIDHGQKILFMMLQASNMLPIGEDLGDVPPEVKEALSTLGICGTRVMRWERKWEKNGEFILPSDYAIDTVTTVSTHDSENVQNWWGAEPLEAKLFADCKGWSYHPILSREYLREILWDSHHTRSLFHINPLQEYLALIPGLTWAEPENERINIPGVVSEHNWRYRLRPSIEELASQPALLHIMKELIQ